MNILIVDDDNTNKIILSSMLKHEGFNTLQAANGVEAIEVFKSNSVDMVLMDILMPKMNGYDAAREIKTYVSDKFVPIIFLTAITDENALAKCVEYGGDDFLTKPYNRIILRSKIDALLRIRDLYSTLNKQNEKLKELNDKIESDISLASHVYKSLIKTNTIPGDIFKTWIAPVSSFNGDIALVMQNHTGGYHVMLGDFTGHGMAAALGTIPVCDLFQDMTQRGYKILDIIVAINNKLENLLPTGYFCASIFISISSTGHRVDLFNAGMPKIMIKENQNLHFVESSHLPLGIIEVEGSDIKFESINIEEPTRICIYSDGLVECKNSESELFGYDRLEKILLENDNIHQVVQDAVKKFTNLECQEDDISMVDISLPIQKESFELISNGSQYDWAQSYDFDAASMKTIDPVMIIIDAILSNNIPVSHKDRIYTIITELFNNSLEHGLLGLDSSLKSTPEGFSEYYEQRQLRLENIQNGNISIKVENHKDTTGGKLRIELCDTGQGFDFERLLQQPMNNNIFSGRGIFLVKSICESLEYSDYGRKVVAIYDWD